MRSVPLRLVAIIRNSSEQSTKNDYKWTICFDISSLSDIETSTTNLFDLLGSGMPRPPQKALCFYLTTAWKQTGLEQFIDGGLISMSTS